MAYNSKMNGGNIYKKIYDSAIKFLVPLSTPEVYRVIVNEAINLTNAREGSIFLFKDGKPERVFTTNKKLKKIIPRREGVTYQVYETHLPNMRHKNDLLKVDRRFSEIPIESDLSIPLNYGHITLGVLSVLSKQDKKFTTEDLDTLNLFGPLATLAIRKTQLHDEAKKSIDIRDWFISLAAHELKNPLTSAILTVELLKRSKNLKDLPEYEKIAKLGETLDRLSSLTDELLQVDRIRTGKLEYNMSEISLPHTVTNCIVDSRERYPNHKIKLDIVDKNIIVFGDSDKLTQAFTNVLNNSVKFSQPGTTITVKVQQKMDKAVVSIKDEGEGIREEDLNKVFRQFYRGGSNKEGMGVGLFLVKQIINRHGGSISIKSKVNAGTTVIMNLPLYSPSNAKRTDTRSANSSRNSK